MEKGEVFLCESHSVGTGNCCLFHKHCKLYQNCPKVGHKAQELWTLNKKKFGWAAFLSTTAVLFVIVCLILVPGGSRQQPGPVLSSRFKLSFPQVEQEDLFISVKTTKKFHRSRLDVVVDTWFQLARDETWFFTDGPDPGLDARTNGHLRVTNCPQSHNRQALCCKMAAEFDAFLQSGKKWFCHFDDDNYVNVPALVRKLRGFDYRQDHYLGKPSIAQPLEILDRENKNHRVSFLFATGGAGFCLSRSVAQKMAPIAGQGQFAEIGDKIRLPDDVTMGYIAEKLVDTPLTVLGEFHSHLEPQRLLDVAGASVKDQISFSYSQYGDEMNILDVSGFSEQSDPTRFKSLHCKLYPNFSWCPKQ